MYNPEDARLNVYASSLGEAIPLAAETGHLSGPAYARVVEATRAARLVDEFAAMAGLDRVVAPVAEARPVVEIAPVSEVVQGAQFEEPVAASEPVISRPLTQAEMLTAAREAVGEALAPAPNTTIQPTNPEQFSLAA